MYDPLMRDLLFLKKTHILRKETHANIQIVKKMKTLLTSQQLPIYQNQFIKVNRI